MQGGQPIIAHLNPNLLKKTICKQNGRKLGSRSLLILCLGMPTCLCSGVFTCLLNSCAYACAYALVKTSIYIASIIKLCMLMYKAQGSTCLALTFRTSSILEVHIRKHFRKCRFVQRVDGRFSSKRVLNWSIVSL